MLFSVRDTSVKGRFFDVKEEEAEEEEGVRVAVCRVLSGILVGILSVRVQRGRRLGRRAQDRGQDLVFLIYLKLTLTPKPPHTSQVFCFPRSY